jgi:histidyl-tRNA synthetase
MTWDSMEKITSVRGFKDILPGETEKWSFVEEKARKIFIDFGYREIKIPILEKTDLFVRGIGEATDIVEKEMYTFRDRGNEYLTLRPEATASIIRAYLEHNMHVADPVSKLFTIGPMFRRERPQKGRFRQFYQIDVEIIGLNDPRVDAELMLMLVRFLSAVGLSDLKLEINSLGCPQCRPLFRETVITYLRGREDGLCPDCQRRLETNPLRIFDCKVDTCQETIASAPVILDYICDECRQHFAKVKDYLTMFDVTFDINVKMVRGLDYYTQTAFEVITESLGAQNAVAGGGRYDGLAQELGGEDIPGVGFAIGFERLISMIPMKNEYFEKRPHLFIAALGDKAQKFAYIVMNKLRLEGIRTEMDYSDKSLKSQMKRSNKLNSSYTLIVGQTEIDEKAATLRNMNTGEQSTIDINNIDDLIDELKNIEFEDLKI